jgi:hypothetical protein
MVAYADVGGAGVGAKGLYGSDMAASPIALHLTRPVDQKPLGELSTNDRTLRLGRQVEKLWRVQSVDGCTCGGASGRGQQRQVGDRCVRSC